MAQLKDLIVNGPSRFIGNITANDSFTLGGPLIVAGSSTLESPLSGTGIKVISEAISTLMKRVESLEDSVDTKGDLSARSVTSSTVYKINNDPIFRVDALTPSISPDFIGQLFIRNSSDPRIYYAPSNSSSSDWIFLLDNKNYSNYAVNLTGPQTIGGNKTFSNSITFGSITNFSGNSYYSNSLFMGSGTTGIYFTSSGINWHNTSNQHSSNLLSFSSSYITSYKSILPSESNSYNLGSTGRYWSNLYVNNASISNQLSVSSIKIGDVELSTSASGILTVSGLLVALNGLASATALTESSGTGVVIFTGPWSDYTTDKANYALAASLGNDLHSRVTTLEGKATNVLFAQSLSAGKQIGTITIDGTSTNLYAPSTYAWSEVTGKPSFGSAALLNSTGTFTSIQHTDYPNNQDQLVSRSFMSYWNGAYNSAGKSNLTYCKYGAIGNIVTKSISDFAAAQHTHNYIPIIGGVYGDVEVYSIDSDTLIGNPENSYWVTIREGMCGPDSDDQNWSIYTSGSASFVDVRIGGYTAYHTGNLTKSTLGLGNVQNTAFYKRQATVNGTTWDLAGTTNSLTTFTIYAPTSAGTSGQILQSTGGTPSWVNKSSISLSSFTDDILSGKYLPLSGGALTGNVSLKETYNIILRPNDSSYTAGIGYDTNGNECIALWAKNSVTRLRWHAGTDMSSLTSGKMMGITPDFEISKASGTAIGYIAGQTILHSGNYNSYSPTLTGTGASGTWGISITGNAATATKLSSAKTISCGTGVSSKSTSFDGTTNIVIPITNLDESYLWWGGEAHNSYIGPVEQIMCGPLSGNRFAGISASDVTIEYSNDAINYYDYGASDSEKRSFFCQFGATFVCGKNSDSTTSNNNHRLRVTVRCTNVYTVLYKAIIYISRVGSSNCWVKLSLSNDNETYEDKGTYSIDGWPGYNSIPLNGYVADPSARGGYYYKYWRFEFGGDFSENSSGYTGLCIHGIEVFGGVGWKLPSDLARYNRPYKFDYSGHASFISSISATSFIGPLSGNATSATKLATARTIWGQSFDGTGNVSGALTNTGTITPSATHTYNIGSSSLVYEKVYTRYIDTDSGYYLRLSVAGTDRMIIDTSGNVGIGTTAPSYKLDVAGTLHTTGDAVLNGALKVVEKPIQLIGDSTNTNTNASSPILWLGALNYDTSFYTGSYIQAFSDGGYGNHTLSFFTKNSTDYTTAPVERVRITSNGNLLVGTTTNSGYKLDVSGSGRFTGAVTLGSTLSVSGATTLSSTLSVSGRATLGAITSNGCHSLISDGNEFNFIPDSYNDLILINYRTASGSLNGSISEYRFCKGGGINYSDIRCSNLYATGGTLTIGSATLTWDGTALVINKPLVSTSFAAGATASSDGSSTATTEWYNLRTISTGTLNAAPTVIIENYDESMASELSDTSTYRFCLMTLKKHWRIPMLTPRWNPDTGSILNIATLCDISWKNTWWPVTSNKVCWFSQTGATLGDVGLGIRTNGDRFPTTGSKRRYLGCAIFKKTGKGHSGWERMSNIAKIAIFSEGGESTSGYNIRILE